MNTVLENYIVPPVNVLEDDERLIIEAEVPGVSREDAKIELRDGRLTIEAQRPANGNGGNYRLRERSSAGYYRAFRLGDTIDTNQIEADLDNGVLRISLAKQPRFQPRVINVN